MAPEERTRKAVSHYARKLVRHLRGQGQTWSAIGDLLKVTHAYVQNIANPEKYGEKTVGPEIEQRMADLIFGGSVEALRRAALNNAEPPDTVDADAVDQETIIRKDAIGLLRRDGFSKRDAERAIGAVVAFQEGKVGMDSTHLAHLGRSLLSAERGKEVRAIPTKDG